MKVFLNHQEICVGSRVTLRDLLTGRSMTGDGTSVAVSNRIVDKEEWRETFLANGDKVTVIKSVGIK